MLHLQILNRLHDSFLFNFVLLSRILVGYTNIYLCELLNFNPFSRNFLNFTIFVLTWYHFTSYSIVLPTSISDWVFSHFEHLF